VNGVAASLAAQPERHLITEGGPEWTLLDFDALDTRGLYELLRLRAAVFVVEQSCAFQDLDGLDPQALHLLGRQHGSLVAYARCFAAGVTFAEASIGRIVTRDTLRGTGLGHRLVERAMQAVGERWGIQPIRIGAQARLKHFYRRHGFKDVNRAYVEDGIEHLEMLWVPGTTNQIGH
jgi:ElaA protein